MLQEARCFHDTQERDVNLFLILGNFTEEIPIAPLAFLAHLKDTFDICGVFEGEAVRVLGCLQSSCAKKKYEAHIANGMSTVENHYRGNWPVVINALMQCLLKENVLHEAHGLVTQAYQWMDGDKLEFET